MKDLFGEEVADFERDHSERIRVRGMKAAMGYTDTMPHNPVRCATCRYLAFKEVVSKKGPRKVPVPPDPRMARCCHITLDGGSEARVELNGCCKLWEEGHGQETG